jgi:phosphoglycerate dehydrogenase-like enzyme
MNIAIYFTNNKHFRYYKLINNATKKYQKKLNIKYINTIIGLKKFKPEIIVAHEDDSLSRYVATNPENLKWIHFMSAGIDRFLKNLNNANVNYKGKITNTRGIHGEYIGEYVLSGILYFEKRLGFFEKSKKNKEWVRVTISLIKSKTVLIYGTGGVGAGIAKTLKANGLIVKGVSLHGKRKKYFTDIFHDSQSSEYLKQADFVISALPLTNLTAAFFDNNKFKKMKKNSVFINVSRAEVVDEKSLINSIKKQEIKGAILDVFMNEPLKKSSLFWKLENVLITPHIAGFFESGKHEGVILFLKNLNNYLANKKMKFIVDPSKGY